MFSARCANPDCEATFDYRQGHFFRFYSDHLDNEDSPNTHSVRHFWLCVECCREHTLEYRAGRGVLLKRRADALRAPGTARFIAAA